MRLVRFASSDGPRLGLQEVDADDNTLSLFDLTDALNCLVPEQGAPADGFRDVAALARAGWLAPERLRELLRDYHGGKAKEKLAEPRQLLAPIHRPEKIIALGMNYAKHARELGTAAPAEPIIFSKAASAIIGPGEPVVCKPEWGRIDPEVELAVVMGRRAKEAPLAEAMEYVGGYTVLNDMTAREMQARDMAARQPWFRSKSIDTFCPLGPSVVLPDEIADPGNLKLEMRVNGEVRQQASTSDLIFGVPFLIHYISGLITLEPGDIIATGTPEGIAPVQPGDVMEAWVEKIGVLRNPVVQG